MSYLLNSDAESLVIDPVYPIDEYIQEASEIGSKISKIIDTHQHADHVSAAKELSQKMALYITRANMRITVMKVKVIYK